MRKWSHYVSYASIPVQSSHGVWSRIKVELSLYSRDVDVLASPLQLSNLFQVLIDTL
jgi:hypothetical protein